MNPYVLAAIHIILFIIGLYAFFCAGVNLFYTRFVGGSKYWYSIPLALIGAGLTSVPFVFG